MSILTSPRHPPERTGAKLASAPWRRLKSIQGTKAEQAQYFSHRFEAVVANVERFIQGKDDVVRPALIGLLAEGHL